MSGEARMLAEVIRSHHEGSGWQADESNHLVYDCACGTTSPPLVQIESFIDEQAVAAAAAWHDDHLAAMVLAWVAEVFAGEREACVEACAEALTDSTSNGWQDIADAVTTHLLGVLGRQEAAQGSCEPICGPSSPIVDTEAGA